MDIIQWSKHNKPIITDCLMATLPNEIIILIIKWMNVRQKIQIFRICQTWYHLSIFLLNKPLTLQLKYHQIICLFTNQDAEMNPSYNFVLNENIFIIVGSKYIKSIDIFKNKSFILSKSPYENYNYYYDSDKYKICINKTHKTIIWS